MATLSLRISLEEGVVTKTIQFDPSTTVFDACRIIREKAPDQKLGEPKDYGLFLSSEEDNKKGVWLEPARSLEYYILRNGDLIEYKKKMRTLRVRMLDGSLKTMLVDDSQNVANLMVVICTKIGITNYDEYSLVREDLKEELETVDNKSNYGTLTLKRKQADRERDPKMDQLRKKLRTDDEVNWIDPSKTLREQGVDESEILLLKRKFFFSDQNIDSRDPVQLNLLYVQARDAILDGTHPVTVEKACEFAGIQCQIQFGDHKEDKHTPGFLDLKEFLPQSYVKNKGIEKKVFKEHKQNFGLSELDAKVKYTRTARALKTYGVAFFLVKEKMKGRNKLVPRLLGVTKDSVLRLDERTKEILQTWPLTTVRRWCASPNTFTLDFGDYSDQYYSVQTTEAEQILQVIAGYIDIILKKQKAKDHFGIEGDEGSTMVEDSVAPLRATTFQIEESRFDKVNTESLAKPAVMRAGPEGVKPYSQGHMAGAQFTTVSGQVNLGHAPSTLQQTKITTVLTEPQRALLSTISSGQEIIREIERELIQAEIIELGSDPASIKWKEVTLDTNKQNVSHQIAAMNAATAQVVTLTSGPTDEVDHTAVGAAITTITSNLPEVTKGVKMIAALMDDNDSGDKLLDATRHLCNAFSDLLKAAEPETKEPRQNLLNAASRVGEASTQVLHTIGEDNEENREIQDMLLALAKAVANTTASLVLKAKNIAATCKDDQQAQNRVIGAAAQCALATSQLVACAKVVAPTLSSPACREQISGAAKQVAIAVQRLVQECEKVAPQSSPSLRDLAAAAADVTKALDDLLRHVNADHRQAKETIHETSVESIMTATDRLVSSSGNTMEMVRQARLLGQATAQLIQNIKIEAEKQPDSETQRRLLAAAKMLADATAKMVEAARQCASSPHDKNKQDALCRAAEEIRYVTTDYASSTPNVRRQLFNRLSSSAKQAASSGTQLISSAHNAGTHNSNKHSQDTLVQECKVMAEHIPRLIEGVRLMTVHPEDSNAQLELINASEAFLQPGAHVAQAARAVLPTVQDQSSALQLNKTTQQFITSCADLRTAVGRARLSCTGLELDAAAEIIRSLQRELDEVDQAAREFRLKPLPGETAESASQDLTNAGRSVGGSAARLISATQQGSSDYAGRAAQDTAHALRSYAGAARGLVATAPETRENVINSTHNIMAESLMLIEEAKHCLAHPNNFDVTRLTSIGKNVSIALDHGVNVLPGHQDVDITIETIDETLQILNMGEFPSSNKSYGQLQQELNVAAAGLTSAATDTVQSVESPAQLGDTSKQFGRAFNELLSVSMEMAGQTTDYDVQSQMVMSMKNVTIESSKLLKTAKSVTNDPMQPNAKNKLSAAARAVTDSVNYLVDVCTSAAPGQKECDSAVRSIQSIRPMLQHPSEPVNDLSYYQCVDTIIDQSKTLGDGMSGMANNAKISDHEHFGKSVKTVSDSICGLIECTAQAAYLVAVSDPTSMAGRPGLVDQSQFARASQVIQQACTNLCNPTSNEQQVLSAATLIAKHTSSLCNACRAASSKTTNPVAKRHFVQSAKEVANSTATLVKEIKALDNNYSEANRTRCANATVPLLDAVKSLCQYANSPEFVSVPARISTQARRAQEPILESGRKIIQASCSMIESAKYLAVEPNDKSQWQGLAVHSRTVSDSIKSLVNNIKDKAPGQSECLAAIDTLNNQLREIDQASLMAASQTLSVRKGNTLQGYTEQMESSVIEMLDKLEPLRAAAKTEAENLGHTVNQMISYAEPLSTAAIGTASNLADLKQQQIILDQTKTVIEGCNLLILAAKEAGGNPRATVAHSDVDEHCQNVRDAAADLLTSAENISAQRGIVSGLLESLNRSMTRVTDHRMSLVGSFNESDSFVDYQTRMVGAAKEIARLATEMTAKSGTDVTKLAMLAGDLTHRYNQLAQDSVGAAAITTSNDVAQKIRSTVVDLGSSVINLVNAGGICQVSKDTHAQRQVTESSKQVSERVGAVLSALHAGSRGTQACIDAVATIAAIIGDLDTTILFASAGTLHAENENDNFGDHRESILITAKSLVKDTTTLVNGAASSQEQLATAAQNAVSTIVQLSEVVKKGAMSLGSGNPDSQVMLIHAVRDVAAALKDFIQATKDASGKHIGDPAMARLKESAKMGNTDNTDDRRRWSLPSQYVRNERVGVSPEVRSTSVGPDACKFQNARQNSCSNYDSETDWFVSDQEEELIRILEDSSQDEIDNYEKHVENLCGNAKVDSVVSLNSSQTQWSYKNNKNTTKPHWKFDMEFRILRYAEVILLNEIKKLEEVVKQLSSEQKSTLVLDSPSKFVRMKDLDIEMKNIVKIIKGIDSNEKSTNRFLKPLKVNKKKIIKLSPAPEESPLVANYLDNIHSKEEYWQMFNIEAEIWRTLFIKNYEKNLETKQKLEKFSKEELKIDNVDYETEKNKGSQADEVIRIDNLEIFKKDVMNNQQHTNKPIDLINDYEGFDPIIEMLRNKRRYQLRHLSNKNEYIIEAFDKIYGDASDIENADLSFSDLCKIESHYEEIEKIYRRYYEEEINSRYRRGSSSSPINKPCLGSETDKNILEALRRENSNIMTLEDLKRLTSKIMKNKTVTTTTTSTNLYKDIESSSIYQGNNVLRVGANELSKAQRYSRDMEEMCANYPTQFYANNWWSIYDDIVKNRAGQFGTIERWWDYYEKIPKSMTKESRQTEKPVMVTNVTSLLKTVKAVEDEHTRGTRALEATIEAIAQEIKLLLSPGAPKLIATPEELVRCTKAITVVTAKAVAAGNSGKQDDVIAAANMGRKAIGDMLAICKGVAYKSAETEDLRNRTLKAGNDCASSYRDLLQAVLKSLQGQTSAKQTFPEHSRAVAQAAADIVAVVELLKGSDWVDPDDPTVIAENELLGAAASIDAAANKLAALRPRKPVKEADETLNFDEMILEAAKSIISATSALVRAASAAQRELIDQGKVVRKPLHSSDDGQWSEGLISAARLTAAAAHSLAECANALVQGVGSEERLVSAARQVAVSTAQLLVACKVKADPNSESTRRLQKAGNAVIKSTDNLVKAAQRAISHEEERCLVLNRRMVGGIAQEIDAKSEVLRIEGMLQAAKERVVAIQRAKYKLNGGEVSGDDTDNEITLHSHGYSDSRVSPYGGYSTLNSSRQDGGYTSDTSPYGKNFTSSFGQSSFNKSNEFVTSSPSYNQKKFGQEYSTVNKTSTFTSNAEKSVKYPSPPPANPPPPMSTNLSTFSRTSLSTSEDKLSKAPQNYEGFTTRSSNPPNTNYETRCYETPRSPNSTSEYYNKTEEERKSYNNENSAFSTYSSIREQNFDSPRIVSNLDKPKSLSSPMSPKFNAKFDLKREFESSDLSHNNYSQNVLTPTHDLKSPMTYLYGAKSPTSPKPFASSEMVKMESYSQQQAGGHPPQSPSHLIQPPKYGQSDFNRTGYSETQQAYSFRSGTSLKGNVPSVPSSDKMSSPGHETLQMAGKESYSYGGPNYSQETMTEVKDIPNGTQKITTTKIYSSSPMKITSMSTKYDSSGPAQPQYDSMNDFNREFGQSSHFSQASDTTKSYTSQGSVDPKTAPSFLRPSDFQQSDFHSAVSVIKSPKSPSELARELDSMEKKFSKQTLSSEVVEKKTVMTTSSKSETSSTMMKKFANY